MASEATSESFEPIVSSNSSSSPSLGQQSPAPDRPSYKIIYKVFPDYNHLSFDDMMRQLDEAVGEEHPVILIESEQLARDTFRWLAAGQFIQQACSACGFVCLVSATPLLQGKEPSQKAIVFTGIGYLLTYFLHRVSFLRDPCSKYAPMKHSERRQRILDDYFNHDTENNHGGLQPVILERTGRSWQTCIPDVLGVSLVLTAAFVLGKNVIK